jgi:hypothetical protein
MSQWMGAARIGNIIVALVLVTVGCGIVFVIVHNLLLENKPDQKQGQKTKR